MAPRALFHIFPAVRRNYSPSTAGHFVWQSHRTREHKARREEMIKEYASTTGGRIESVPVGLRRYFTGEDCDCAFKSHRTLLSPCALLLYIYHFCPNPRAHPESHSGGALRALVVHKIFLPQRITLGYVVVLLPAGIEVRPGTELCAGISYDTAVGRKLRVDMLSSLRSGDVISIEISLPGFSLVRTRYLQNILPPLRADEAGVWRRVGACTTADGNSIKIFLEHVSTGRHAGGQNSLISVSIPLPDGQNIPWATVHVAKDIPKVLNLLLVILQAASLWADNRRDKPYAYKLIAVVKALIGWDGGVYDGQIDSDTREESGKSKLLICLKLYLGRMYLLPELRAFIANAWKECQGNEIEENMWVGDAGGEVIPTEEALADWIWLKYSPLLATEWLERGKADE